MLTYTTLDRDLLDLRGLSDDEQAFLMRCLSAWRADMPWGEFSQLVEGVENPLLRSTSGRITRAVREHVLWRAVRDLEDRLGIRQGEVLQEAGDDLEGDPVADEWIPSAEAARRVGVTLSGLHCAIRRGDVIAQPVKPGAVRLVVSVKSLSRWTPNRVRQAAGRGAAVAAR